MADIQLSGSVGAGGSFAILGRANVEVVGDVDLVLSLAQYSNYFMQVTSDNTSTGIRSVIAPLNEGTSFIVQNKTSEGFAIVLKGPSGTGVAIPPASSALVATDGTNYFTPSAGTGFSPALIVPTIAALGAVSTVALQTSYPAIVQSVGADWTFEAAGALPVDGITVIAATPAGQWWRGATRIAVSAQAQATWAIDPAAGNDEASGAPGHPLKTAAELTRRWGTTEPDIEQETTVALVSSQPNFTDYIRWRPRCGNANFYLVGTPTVVGAGVLSGVIAKNRATPQLLTAALPGAGLAAGMMVVNATRGNSVAFLYVHTAGSTWKLSQPLTPIPTSTPYYLPLAPPAEVDTWANGDAVTVYQLPSVNLAELSCQGASEDNVNIFSFAYAQHLAFTFTQCTLGENTYATECASSSGVYKLGGGRQGNDGFVNFASSSQVHGTGYAGSGAFYVIGGFYLFDLTSTGGGIVLDGDVIYAPNGNTPIGGWFTAIGFVYIEAGKTLAVQAEASIQNTGLGFGGAATWGPGITNAIGAGRFAYAPNAVTAFLHTGGMQLNNVATAYSVGAGAAAAWNGGIAITPANLDAAFGVAGFGGRAVNPGGGSYVQAVS